MPIQVELGGGGDLPLAAPPDQWPGIARRLAADPAATAATILDERVLYGAASHLKRRQLAKVLAVEPVARRIAGFGLYLLGQGGAHARLAWWPFAGMLPHSVALQELIVRDVPLHRPQREALENMQRQFRGTNQFLRTLEFLSTQAGRPEMRDLIEMMANFGSFTIKLKARAILIRVDKELTRQQAERAKAEAAPAYPELIPVSEFRDFQGGGDSERK